MKLLVLLAAMAACSKHRSQEVVGGCAYQYQAGVCSLAEDRMVDANTDDPKDVAVRARYIWNGDVSPPPVVDKYPRPELNLEWTVKRDKADALTAALHARPTVTCRLEILQTGSCPPWPRVVAAETPVPAGQVVGQ